MTDQSVQSDVAYAVAEVLDDGEYHSLSYLQVAEAAADGIADYLLDWSDPAFLEDVIPALHAATKRLAQRCNLQMEAAVTSGFKATDGSKG